MGEGGWCPPLTQTVRRAEAAQVGLAKAYEWTAGGGVVAIPGRSERYESTQTSVEGRKKPAQTLSRRHRTCTKTVTKLCAS